jgi:hybrid polyketide synthase/nonribosomal peptide synthetase ACE1
MVPNRRPGHLRQDGTLYAHGRILSDTQVKVRGFRVELQEVENVLLETAEGALSHAVVTLQSLGENGLLAAHVVFAPNFMSHSHQQIMNYLGSVLPLPSYMQPALIVPLKSNPVTTNSKVDRSLFRHCLYRKLGLEPRI